MIGDVQLVTRGRVVTPKEAAASEDEIAAQVAAAQASRSVQIGKRPSRRLPAGPCSALRQVRHWYRRMISSFSRSIVEWECLEIAE